MSINTCNAFQCNLPAGKDAWMCREHWYKVPLLLRNKLAVHARNKNWSGGLVQVTLALARREVGLLEGTFRIDEANRTAGIQRWLAVRDKLRSELADTYEYHVGPFRERLWKLVIDCGGSDPLEVAALAIKFDPRPDDEAKRIAAAIDLYEEAVGELR